MENIVQSEELASLPVGTEVSAKYKGAFCEAKVKKVNKNVLCKVTFKQVRLIFTPNQKQTKLQCLNGAVCGVRFYHGNV